MSRDSVRRATSVVVRGVLVIAIGLTLFVAYGLVDNAWYHVLVVRGASMQPAITAGDLIVITRPPERIEVGQVLTLQVDGSIVTHRVVEVRPDGSFVTQGDANDARDDFSANEVRVAGEYRFSLPLIGMLIEPLVSGAWFAETGPTGVAAQAGTWGASEGPRAIMWTGRGLVWTPPSQEPTATPSPTPVPVPPANGSEEPTATVLPSPEQPAPTAATTTATPTSVPAATPAETAVPSPSVEPSPTPAPSPSATP